MTGYQSGVWEGVQEGDRLIMRQGGRTKVVGATHCVAPTNARS